MSDRPQRTDRYSAGVYLLTVRSGTNYIARLTAIQAQAVYRLSTRYFTPPTSFGVVDPDDRTVRSPRALVVNITYEDILRLGR